MTIIVLLRVQAAMVEARDAVERADHGKDEQMYAGDPAKLARCLRCMQL